MTKTAKDSRNLAILQKLAKDGRIDQGWVNMVATSHHNEVYKPRTPRGKKGGQK